MNKFHTSIGVTWRVCILSALLIAIGIASGVALGDGFNVAGAFLIAFIGASLCSLPAMITLLIFLNIQADQTISWQIKFKRFLMLQLIIALMYGAGGALFNAVARITNEGPYTFLMVLGVVGLILFACSAIATFLCLTVIANHFSYGQTATSSYQNIFNSLFHHSKINTTMEANEQDYYQQPIPAANHSNKLLIKGVITGVLILLMLIPTFFINNIIKEREERQHEVVKEVSSKWAMAQTITGPYLVIPYTDTSINNEGIAIRVKKQLIVLPQELKTDGKIFPEQRPRSIYKVLLYKSAIGITGNFKPSWPSDISIANLDFSNSRLCFGLSDFKGIEEEIKINFQNKLLTLSPGLPVTDFGDIGLSVPVSTSLEEINAGISFNMNVKLKGSEQLYFMPLSANSQFSLGSPWPSPSFDGNVLPNERKVDETGFQAKWNFNQANLPFGTIIKSGSLHNTNIAFGVSMVQPADQYDKTMRSVKYAILFIGLTFALFFIIEIMQKKPFHPVQYVLVGLALVIFYTLLLSISEYILFDTAYAIAAGATVLLISSYAQSHFKNVKTALVLGAAMALLYSFIFVLIRLEDTALLVGSIGLFIVLALVMYASRKVNWYGTRQAD